MFKNLNRRSLTAIAIVAVIIYLICSSSRSGYDTPQVANGAGVVGSDVDAQGFAPASLDGTQIDLKAMNSGTGLASSLLPREVVSQENFGEFSPDQILEGKNFLDPRQQIGWPETIGGTLRNANQQVRADPPNPKQPYTWNNSTIVPDLMQRKICT
ncbi:hypothetical protein N9C10_02960 [Flavobacteriaceae bacterium]|nr:hypothetical protein [Flavobacteriaceae bacterium]